MKKCARCLGEFPLGCFNKSRGKKSKRVSICKACQLEERAGKLIIQVEQQKRNQLRLREVQERYDETRRVKRELWEKGVMAASGEREY